MSELADIITGEFEEAVEVKNQKSLHRGIYLLLSSTVPKEEHKVEHDSINTVLTSLNNNVELIAVEMREGFKRMDEHFEFMEKRFEAVDRRFEAVDKRFESMEERFEKRFDAIDRRFEAMDRKFNRNTTVITAGFAFMAVLVTVLKFVV